ncbi:hypothetical protein EDB80DRAFT_771607 [Ilyonectria destructans]|nr:hypothetical protein EDB80DRAFT_771607 [Ilyonectria destructans]
MAPGTPYSGRSLLMGAARGIRHPQGTKTPGPWRRPATSRHHVAGNRQVRGYGWLLSGPDSPSYYVVPRASRALGPVKDAVATGTRRGCCSPRGGIHLRRRFVVLYMACGGHYLNHWPTASSFLGELATGIYGRFTTLIDRFCAPGAGMAAGLRPAVGASTDRPWRDPEWTLPCQAESKTPTRLSHPRLDRPGVFLLTDVISTGSFLLCCNSPTSPATAAQCIPAVPVQQCANRPPIRASTQAAVLKEVHGRIPVSHQGAFRGAFSLTLIQSSKLGTQAVGLLG